MKYLNLIVVIIFLLSFNPPHYSTAQSSLTRPFTLQCDLNNSLQLFSVKSPENVILEVNVTSQNGSVSIGYLNQISYKSYTGKSVEIYPHTYYNLSLFTNSINLDLSNNSNSIANYSATGLYRIQQGQYNPATKWYPYNLSYSVPNSLTIFETRSSWVDSVSVNISVNQVYRSSLDLYFSQGDAFSHIPISQTGSFNYTFNTSFIGLSVYSKNYSRITGYYYILDHGYISQNTADSFQYFMVILGIVSVFIIKKRKNL